MKCNRNVKWSGALDHISSGPAMCSDPAEGMAAGQAEPTLTRLRARIVDSAAV